MSARGVFTSVLDKTDISDDAEGVITVTAGSFSDTKEFRIGPTESPTGATAGELGLNINGFGHLYFKITADPGVTVTPQLVMRPTTDVTPVSLVGTDYELGTDLTPGIYSIAMNMVLNNYLSIRFNETSGTADATIELIKISLA